MYRAHNRYCVINFWGLPRVMRGMTLSALALILNGSISKRPESAACFFLSVPLLTDQRELSVDL